MRAPDARRGERGAVAALLIIALAMLVAFLAASLNLGHLASTRSEVQTGADAGALAGARILDGTDEKLTLAKSTAAAFGSANPSDGTNLDVPQSDVELGRFDMWNPACRWSAGNPPPSSCFTPLPTGPAAQVQAVRVSAYRDANHSGGAVTQFFASLLRQESTRAVKGQAIAVGGGPIYVACAQMPIVVSGCVLNTEYCDHTYTVHFQTDPADNAGWTGFSLDASAYNVRNFINSSLTGQCVSVLENQTVTLNNGSITSACDTLENVWRVQGSHYDFVVPVVDTGGCPPDFKFNQTAIVKKFIYINITTVVCKPASDARVDIQVVCGKDPPLDSIPGGAFTESIMPVPALVQ